MAQRKGSDRKSGFIGRLRRNVAGNTLAIMAAALVPMIAFSGSAIDIARLYVVKVRLQQSCDAGVLAGRRAMTDNSMATPLDLAASTQAQQFFNSNFNPGFYQSSMISFTPVKASQGTSTVANAVTGTATATVPMALMQYFKAPAIQLTVKCQAVYDLADTDVMFVLDTTGSMSCYPSDDPNCAGPNTPYTRSDNSPGFYDLEKSPTMVNGSTMYSKIESLRRAVLLFDSTLRSNADSSTHFRYGFVPYNSAVNVGALIPSNYLQSGSWTYQSRQVSADYNYGGVTNFSLTGIAQSICVAQRYPGTPLTYLTSGPNWNTSYYQAMQYNPTSWNPSNGGTCSGTQQPLRATWLYQPYTLNIGQYEATLLSNGPAVTNPSRLDGITSKWRGCIEEVNTAAASSFNVSSLPDDLNPDFIPTVANDMWRPMWQDAEWARNGPASQPVHDDQVNEASPQYYTDVTYRIGGLYDTYGTAACPAAGQRLSVMSAQQVQNYVYGTDFKPFGGTYHDVGMIWGTRMLSPNGVFGADTAPWPGRNPPSRSIIFMTDGTMSPSQISYGQYGVEQIDQRVDAGGDSTADYNNHTARFRIECDAAKARGITIYVVALGTAVTTDLSYCSSPGQAFTASSTDQLTAAFKSIAQRVAKLRISQ